jgi:hypothetical protein
MFPVRCISTKDSIPVGVPSHVTTTNTFELRSIDHCTTNCNVFYMTFLAIKSTKSTDANGLRTWPDHGNHHRRSLLCCTVPVRDILSSKDIYSTSRMHVAATHLHALRESPTSGAAAQPPISHGDGDTVWPPPWRNGESWPRAFLGVMVRPALPERGRPRYTHCSGIASISAPPAACRSRSHKAETHPRQINRQHSERK